MKILVCSNFFPPEAIGGAEVVAFEHAKVLRARGHEVRVFRGRLGGPARRPYRVTHQEQEFPQTVISLTARDIAGDSWNFANTAVEQAFRETAADFRPDIVHFHNVVGLSVRLVDQCRALGVPTVMTLHDYWAICFKNTMIKDDGRVCMRSGFDCLGCRKVVEADRIMPTPVRNTWLLRSLAGIDHFIVPSQYMTERYVEAGLPRERIAVIKYGVDVRRFTVTAKGNPVLTLGFIGYLGRHKGLAVLLEALGRLRPSNRVRLLVVGDGEQSEALRARAREQGLETRVTFMGRVDHQSIPSIYGQIDALVVPSIWPENSPVTISEAMASGVPVLASDIGGIRELVDHGVTGLLVAPGDSEAMARSIEDWLSEPGQLTRMGQAARERICAGTVEQQVDRILEIYARLADSASPPWTPQGDAIIYHATHSPGPGLRGFAALGDVERILKRRLLVYDQAADAAALAGAKLVLIFSDDDEGWRLAVRAFDHGVPLVVPEQLEDLKTLCVAAGAGLFWREPDELSACVEFLLTDDDTRSALGASGRRFIGRHRAPTAIMPLP